jgi:hypothetical protein
MGAENKKKFKDFLRKIIYFFSKSKIKSKIKRSATENGNNSFPEPNHGKNTPQQ